MSAEKIVTFDGHLRLFPAFWAAILDLEIRKLGIKFDELLIANERHFYGSIKCVKVHEPELLTEPRTEQPCLKLNYRHRSMRAADLYKQTKLQAPWYESSRPVLGTACTLKAPPFCAQHAS